MSYGLFVYGEKEPRAIAPDSTTAHSFLATLTEADFRKGWTIRPLHIQWPARESKLLPDVANVLWATLGGIAVLFAIYIILMCLRGH